MPRKPRINFTVNPELREPLKEQAEEENRTVASLINHAIAEYLKQKGKYGIEKK